MKDAWIRATSVAPAELTDATVQLHWAVQLIASAGQTFVEARPDDSHRAMTWSRHLRAFVGEPFAGPYPFRVALRPADLTLLLLGREDDELGTLPLAGQTLDEGYEWLALGMATYLGGPPPAIERPEYDVPPHPVMEGARFSNDLDAELAALEGLFAGAATLLQQISSLREDASAVRVWPHHFDIATLLTLGQDEDGRATRTVGVGLAPMGGGYDTWYAYVSPWPWPDPEGLPTLDAPARWHTDGWTGAVLHGVDVVDVAPEARSEAVERYFAEALTTAESVLA